MHRKNFDTKQPDEARLALTEPSIVASLSTSTLSSNAKATADLCTEKKQLNDDSKTIVANIKNILTQLPNLTDNRIGLLTAAWLNLQNLIQNKNEDFKNCMQWIIKYTLDSMLTELTKSDAGDLEELKIRINECASLVQEEANFWYRCKYILENIDAPWSHPTLQLIFNDGKNSPTIISKEQLEKEIEYFTIERGCMIDMRVKKLIASKCDRFAMNFVTEALRAIQTCTDDHMLRRVVSLGQNQSLLEIYFSFLYKFKESSRLKVELEAMHLDSAKEFILNCFATIDFYEATNQRLRSTIHASNAMKKAHPAAARLHKYHVSVSQYALQLILVRLLAGEYGNDGVEATFRDLLTEWIRRNREQENFDKLFHKLIQTASSNSRIYECCEILYDLYPNDCETALRIFCSELTKEINILEHKKYDETVNASVILSLEKQTSSRYLTLGKILHAHKKLEKECVLTAFSMNPTHECFQLVCSLATENLAPQVTPHLETIDALPTIICTDMLLNSKEYDALRAPNRLLDSLTSISEEVRSDLVCLLTVPRIKNLNWLVPWPELKQACEELLFTERKRQIVEKTTAGANDNLKYINDNLNYDDFKNFAPHEYPGIEKGYEIYVANSDSDESPVLGTGDSDSDGTDTAPESKQFIVKEEKRLRDRKRRLIRRSQKLLEMSENNMQPEKMSKELDQKKKKPRRLKQMTSDSLKPGKSNRKTQSKQQLYTEYNNIQKDTTSNFGNINNKVESSLDIKTEPLDDHLEIQHDGDVSETFVDRSNIPHLKSENCTINNSFFEITQNQYDDHVQQSQRNGTFAKNDIMPLSNFSELTCLPQQFEQSDNESTTICYNTELVNSIIFDESKNESPEQPFSKICDEDFDEDDKANIHFQHIVMNKILGLNEKQVSHFTNDDTVNNIELNQETKSKSPVINELCPLKPSVEIENIALQNSSSKTLCDVPYTSNITISNPNVQSSKPKKNPLLAFRRPKKIPNKSNDMFAKELNEYTNTITESLPNSFNLEDNSQNNMTENMDHNQENNILTCVTDQKVVSKYQFNKQIDEDLQNTEMDTSSSIVILTKHCTVRLNRIPNLDRMDSSKQIHLAPLDSSSNKSDDFNVKFNYDQLTNGKSSSDNTSQRSQNSNEVKIPAEEDEDEDRKTNLLLPYSSINSSHNNYGNDDDDDCNSSEDTKTNCPGEHVSLKTEQNSGEKQQQQKQQQQKQQQKQQQQQHHCTESNKHEYKMLQHMSSEKQLCSKQTFLMQNRNSDNMKYISGLLLIEAKRNCTPHPTYVYAYYTNSNSIQCTNLIKFITETSIMTSPLLLAEQHIKFYHNMKNKNVKGTISKCNIFLLAIQLKLFVIIIFRKKWHKFYQLLSDVCQMSCISIPTNDVFFKANEIILGSILVYFTYRWRLMVTTILAITHTFITITIIADMAMLLALKTKHFYKYPRKIQTNDSKCIYFKHINQRTNRFEKITSMNFFREKKTYFHSKEKFNLLNSTMFDAISMKSGTKKNFFPQAYLKNIYDSVVIVQMVQIVLSNEKSSVAEPVQQTENVTNNGSLMTSNGMPVTTAQTVATENTDVHTATTSKSNICKIIEDDKSEKTSSQSTNIPIQAVFAPNVNTSPNKNSNVIMVKRSKLKGHSNEIPVSIFRPMSVSTMSKSNIKRSSHAASGRSVIIMNKLDQMKNGSNSNKTEAYEIPAKTNNLLRILNSPPKPINASTLPANLKQTISSTQVFDYQKPIKSQTTGASDAQIPVTKNENIINMDQTKLRNLLNDQNGSKKLNNNFFLCKTEGKVIRLTPLMGSNCFNNIATATVLPSITNGVRVVEDIQQKPICPIIIDKKDPVSSKSPPPLTLAISATNTSVAKTSSFTTHSIFDDIYTKFLNTKEAHIDSIKNNLEMERQNTTTASTQIYNSKFKSNFYTIPTSHEIISSKQHTKTFLQRQNLENSEEINTNSSISTTLSNGKSNTMTNPSQSTSTVFLKHVPKTLYPQSKTDVCDILVTNENNLKILQKPTNDISNTNAATTTNTALNQIHIFPLIANSRNLARTNYVRPQVIITSTNTTDSRIQSIEPDKRNLVDQLREFDMVMEQIKEERNTNEATDNLVLSNLNGILNHHIVDSQIKSAGLQQKINLAIIKKSKAITTQKTVDLLEAKQSTSTSVVVVSNANVATMKSIEPQKDISTKSNVDSSVIQSTLENVASVKINSANLKTVSQSLNQNAAAKHPQKPQEDEHTVQRIYDILAQYAEQISTSPDLNNKPAPRRRIRMVSSKSSVLSSSSSSSSTTTVSSIINSCSNSNSSNESYQSAKMNESRKRFLSLQNDDQCGTDCISTIDSITIQQPAEKKRCLSNIKLEANDFILATVPSLSSYTSPPKSNSNDMLKTSNQIIITTTNSQQQYNTNLIRATVKQDGNNPMLKNINTNLYNDSNKLKPLTIGIANNSGGNDSSEMPQTQSPATILLPNVSMVVSAEQNLQHTKKKFTNSKNTSNDGFYGFTSGFPYKINITSPNKCRQTLKQCVPGQSYRNDNYILPRSLLKYGKNHTAIGEKSKINQTIHSNVTTVMIPSTTNIQRDSTNIKIVSNSDIKRDISKPKHIQFNITKKRESLATIPATSLQSPVGSTLLLRTLSGRNFTDIQNETSDDEIHTIRDSSSENSSNKLPTFTPIKTHQSSIPPFVESIQLPSQIFQSNRGILILDGNKYATLLTTNCTIPTATAPIISDSGLGSIKSSDSTNEPKVTAITTSRTTINVKSKLSKIDMEVPVCNSEHDFLLHNGLNVGSPKCSDDGTDVTFDDFQQNDQIFSMKKLPTLFSENFLKNSDDILHQNDDSDNNVIDDTQEMIFHQHGKSSDNVVIIDKQKSDSLTLNSVSSDSHRTHGITRTHGIIERELRLQKSLSIVNDVEYQDLGVDELAPNDLFPDAFITF